MTETPDEFSLVKSICSHFHTTHQLHVFVHFEQLVFLNLHFERWGFAFEATERVVVQCNREWLRVVGDRVLQLGRPGRGLDGSHKVGLVKNKYGVVITLL